MLDLPLLQRLEQLSHTRKASVSFLGSGIDSDSDSEEILAYGQQFQTSFSKVQPMLEDIKIHGTLEKAQEVKDEEQRLLDLIPKKKSSFYQKKESLDASKSGKGSMTLRAAFQRKAHTRISTASIFHFNQKIHTGKVCAQSFFFITLFEFRFCSAAGRNFRREE